MANSVSRTARSRRRPPAQVTPSVAKVSSGIRGLDEITEGGLPRGRPTLVCGGPGCGKTLFAMEFLVRGAVEHGDPGVLMSFEESEEELAANVASLGFDVEELVRRKKLVIDHVRLERAEIEETGEFNLEGLFVRLDHAISTVGAKRVALDTVESLFAGLPSPDLLRAELRRLFRWLKERGQTVVITGEKGEGQLTRAGLEEYVSDCVIFLDHRVVDQVSTRRLRVVKYRGSTHGTNEYPFLIDEGGISVLPITSLGLDHRVYAERVSTGLARLDEMLGGAGLYRGTTCLVSGPAGSGKTSFAASLVQAAVRRGERSLYVSFEESPAQLVRNMRSIGLDLEGARRSGLLRVEAARSVVYGLEMHLAAIHKALVTFQPELVVLDPITSLINAGSVLDTRSILTRLIDHLKSKGVTALFTNLVGPAAGAESDVVVSSLIDTWLRLEWVRSGAERRRYLTVVKSRGMPHTVEAVPFRLGDGGVELAPAERWDGAHDAAHDGREERA